MKKAQQNSPELQKYRDFLMDKHHQASVSFDKAVMTLSGGALGISLTFLHDVVSSPLPETKIFLTTSWLSFALSLASILISYLTSIGSLRKAMGQVDDGTIYNVKTPGGIPTLLTVTLRITSAIGFLSGVFFFIVFALNNI